MLALLALAALGGGAALAGSSSVPPEWNCLSVEVPCKGDLVSSGPPMPLIECPCGPGEWVLDIASTDLEPQVPFDQVETEGPFVIQRKARATPKSALVRVKGSGVSDCGIGCNSGAATATERAGFSNVQHEYWNGAMPPCARMVGLVAMGGATQAVGVTTTASLGCSASASSSFAGVCTSLGDASAQLGHSMSAQAQYLGASSAVRVSGNIGAMVTVDSFTFQGSCSAVDSWEAAGVGSATGTASFTVKPDRTYCAFTNKAYAKRVTGNVTASGAASVASGGAVAFEGASQIKLWID